MDAGYVDLSDKHADRTDLLTRELNPASARGSGGWFVEVSGQMSRLPWEKNSPGFLDCGALYKLCEGEQIHEETLITVERQNKAEHLGIVERTTECT